MGKKKKTKYTSYIVCPHCGEKVAPGAVQGSWLERTCPECGNSLSASVFDSCAALVTRKEADFAASQAREKDLASRHKQIASLIGNPLFSPVRFLLEKSSDRHNRAKERYAEQAVKARAEMLQLALGRYYASEWYQLTEIPLVNPENPLGEYAFHSEYNEEGRTVLLQDSGKAAAGGISGEWRVFEELMTRIASEDGELAGARLAPNVFLPAAGAKIQGLADQTDLLVLTQKAAFVIEVKNWRSHIRVSRTEDDLVIKSHNDAEKSRQGVHESDKPVSQIRQRMADFALLGVYPADRIYGMVVFVDPSSIERTVKGFINKAAVASCLSDNSGHFITLMEDKLRYKDAVLTQEEVDFFANKLLVSLVDRNGELECKQKKLRDDAYSSIRHDRLTALADLSVNRRQAGYQNRKAHGAMRDSAKRPKRDMKTRSSKKQHYARKQRLYELAQEYDEWDY